jgi:hypothetical protein
LPSDHVLARAGSLSHGSRISRLILRYPGESAGREEAEAVLVVAQAMRERLPLLPAASSWNPQSAVLPPLVCGKTSCHPELQTVPRSPGGDFHRHLAWFLAFGSCPYGGLLLQYSCEG